MKLKFTGLNFAQCLTLCPEARVNDRKEGMGLLVPTSVGVKELNVGQNLIKFEDGSFGVE